MTAVQPMLLPGDPVLIDSHCCSRCDKRAFTRGDNATVTSTARTGEVLVRVARTNAYMWFRRAELVALPHQGDPLYPCCSHCTCTGRPGHSQPCTGCSQLPRESDDQRAARAMNEATR